MMRGHQLGARLAEHDLIQRSPSRSLPRQVTYLGSSVRNREPGGSGIKPLLYGIEARHVGLSPRARVFLLDRDDGVRNVYGSGLLDSERVLNDLRTLAPALVIYR
jgi:hypothetical protein